MLGIQPLSICRLWSDQRSELTQFVSMIPVAQSLVFSVVFSL
jgi:hypothetical protein